MAALPASGTEAVLDSLRVYVIQALIALLVATGVMAAYHYKVAPLPVRFAVVDLASVYRENEQAFTALVSKPGITDAEREVALNRATAFAKALPPSLESLSQDCGCTLLLKTVVAGHGPEVADLTDALRKRLPK